MVRWISAAVLSVALAAIGPTDVPAQPGDGGWQHALSLFGSVKYPTDFTQFDYANADAPKGGVFRRASVGTFDTLNPFNIKGTPGAGSTLIYDTLMTQSNDEPSTEYPLLAEAVRHPADYSSVTYRLNPAARWHDGKPVTVDDVIWSLDAITEASPNFRFYYKNIVKAEKTGDREVTFTFDQTGNRELPQITGQLIVLPKHYWEGVGRDGQKRDLLGATLEPPLGSGPYRFKEVKPGRSISYERVPDYWGKDLPVNVGLHNFDELRFEYYRDLTVRQEAFKADAYDFIVENSAKRWATAYRFPAVDRGDVILQEFRTKNAEPMQGYAFNLRRKKFSDPRVRLAFNYAFDFEWLNENVFFGQYERSNSYFQNSELQATGLPEGRELEILEEVRDQIPPEVFTTEFKNPVGGNPRAVRRNLREARRLLEEAGWTVQNGVLTHQETGEVMEVEFVSAQASSERIVNPYAQALERLGIKATLRIVDVSQYQQRMDTFDFDITTELIAQSLSPGNEQRDFWGSEAADREGSRNTMGIKDPAIDKLIDKIIFAKDRAELIAATRALDRVLLWNHFVVPQFFTPVTRTARWNRFGIPEIVPDYGITTSTWWYDREKAATVTK